MPSSHAAERRNEPTYVDNLDDLRQRDIHPQGRPHPRRRRYDDDYGQQPPRPQRSRTNREPRQYPDSDSESLAQHRRREPRARAPQGYDEDYSPKHRRHQEEDYFSDNRHNRPRRDPYDDRQIEKRRERDPRKDRPSKPERKESKWGKEGKTLFKEYAVPALKAEAGKFVTKQIGNFFAKQ